ncbi:MULTISPECIES: DNA polymerase [unclassified Exiguobacterium]|uniref:DNA polymerase n=1 Tax=unclassified Exiguobacterium TaxID=2644629 RepID=UPI001BEB5B86|nr:MULTISPECIES: DNA polymerase [unclassified Exiguobacterium]
MELNISLSMEDDTKKKERVKEATKKKKAAAYIPTWEEVWITGYTSHTGAFKPAIFKAKNSDSDKQKLKEVFDAINNGELTVGVEDLRKFTKAHALRLFKALQANRKDALIAKMIAERPTNYITVRTEEELHKLKLVIQKELEIAIDTETTGLDYFTDVIVGISITAPEADLHYYIPVDHEENSTQLPRDYVLETLREEFESDDIKKIYFNAKFDIHMFRRHGVKMGGFLFDGLIAMKLLNENETGYALKDLATKYGKHFGFEDKSATFEELFGKGGFERIPIDIGSIYACKDTHLTYRFYKDFIMVHFKKLPDVMKLYFDIERPITEICIEMEQNGFAIDKDFAKQYAAELQEEVDELEREVQKEFGGINLNSPKQLQEMLYDEWRLDDVSGKRSTDKKTLKKLSSHSPAISKLLEYRDLNKLLSTYIAPLPEKVKSDGRLHGQFNQVDTVTGRFASKEPNLQNLPQRARSIIVAPKGYVLLGADFSQIEPRILSHLAEDDTMIDAYVTGKDLYTEMASGVFKLPIEYCLDGQYDPTGKFQPRKAIKAVLLGIMYGMGSNTLAGNIGVSTEEADGIIDDFYETYPKVKAYIDARHQHAYEHEYVTTMYGRKRRFPKHRQTANAYKASVKKAVAILGREPKQFIWEEKLPYKMKRTIWDYGKPYHAVNRQSVNATIQGSAADVMKIAMIHLDEYCKQKGYKMVAQVHDEVLIEVPNTITREEVAEVERIMRECIQLSVPMKVDAELSERWGEGMDVDTWFELQQTGNVTRNIKGYEEYYDKETMFWKAVSK